MLVRSSVALDDQQPYPSVGHTMVALKNETLTVARLKCEKGFGACGGVEVTRNSVECVIGRQTWDLCDPEGYTASETAGVYVEAARHSCA